MIARETPGRASAWVASHPGGYTSGKDGERVRVFRIRGEPGEILVSDERWNPHRLHPREWLKFRTVTGAMVYITEELMAESTP